MYVAKKPYRHSVSWNHINAVGAVFGTRTVEINGSVYKVRLLKSVATDDVYTGRTWVWDPVEAYGSEWNRLFYPIHSTVHTDTRNPTPITGEGIRLGTLAQYTDIDLLVHNSGGNGSYSWCQETLSSHSTRHVYRGGGGVSSLDWHEASTAISTDGWRPVLELVS